MSAAILPVTMDIGGHRKAAATIVHVPALARTHVRYVTNLGVMYEVKPITCGLGGPK